MNTNIQKYAYFAQLTNIMLNNDGQIYKSKNMITELI